MTTECIDTINFGTARTKTAIFEVEGITKCPTRDTLLTLLLHPMDRDIMGHDNDTGIGPCAKVLRNTFGGKIQVIVPGAFVLRVV
jgi:hypothetical protein